MINDKPRTGSKRARATYPVRIDWRNDIVTSREDFECDSVTVSGRAQSNRFHHAVGFQLTDNLEDFPVVRAIGRARFNTADVVTLGLVQRVDACRHPSAGCCW